MNPSLGQIRWKLTWWYVGVFAIILIILGLSLLLVLSRQISIRLDHSLENAAREVVRAAEIRELESKLPPGSVVDAFEELRIPGRMLYIFDDDERLVHPVEAPDWIGPSVSLALESGESWSRHETPEKDSYRIYASRFKLPDGKTWVAVATADVFEVHDEFAALILIFGLAGLASLILVGFGGVALARRSSEPVELAFAQMRRFMADAAHELRTPLTVLRGRAEVAIQRAVTTEEASVVLHGIVGETERMSSMVEKMLLLSQAESGALPVRHDRVFLDDLLMDAASDARVIAAGHGVTVSISELDECPVRADSHLVHQMLLTILENAVRHTPPDGRVFAVASRDGTTATVTITDTGSGMSPEVLAHAFEPFFRGDTTTEHRAGAGLGLTIARSIARAHGASITMASQVCRGTSVTITFPPFDESPDR